MKKVLGLIVVVLLISSAFAIDGAQSIGQGKSKLELGYAGGGVNVAYNMGLNDDLTVYGSIMSAAGVTGFGGGVKYGFLNERKGDSLSFAGKLDLLLGGGTVIPMPGLVVSKKQGAMTLLGDLSTWSTSMYGVSVGYTWIGGGAMWDLNQDSQFSAEIGIATVRASVGDTSVSASGMGVGLGYNYSF